MSRIDISTEELFLRLGSTPRTRSARADSLFRRLRADETQNVAHAIFKAPAMPVMGAMDGQTKDGPTPKNPGDKT